MKLSTQRVLAATAIILIVVLAGTVTFEFVQSRSANLIRVACVGDSITVGSQYPIDLWQLLGPNYVVGDFGVSGTAVARTTHMSYIHQDAFEVAKQFQPNIVIIMLGTNDAYTTFIENDSDFISDYETIVHDFQSLSSKPTVWLVEPIPICNNTINLSNDILVQKVIPNILLVASQTHSQLIDAQTPFINHPELYVDGVHPSGDGARVLADAIYKALIS